MKATFEVPMTPEKWLASLRRGETRDFRFCKHCDIYKPEEQYSKGRAKCLYCRRKYDRERRAKDPEKHREQCRQYRRSRTPDAVRKQRERHIEYMRTTYRERNLLIGARKRAKKNGLDFDLEVEDIFIPEKCPLLGVKINNRGFMNNRDSSPSLDRIDPRKGYVRGNVAIISYRANRIKNDATREELKMIAGRIDEYVAGVLGGIKNETSGKN